MEAHCEGDQGPPRAVMPRKKKKNGMPHVMKTGYKLYSSHCTLTYHPITDLLRKRS
jgi:hypothetical protein